jgi:STE24 endopeptidase
MSLVPCVRAAALLFVFCLIAAAGPARAQDSTLPQLPPHAAPVETVQMGMLPTLDTTPPYDADAATKAYLAQVTGAERASADAYVTGNGWLMVGNLIYALIVAGLLLWLKVSACIREWVVGKTHSRTTQVLLCTICYALIAAIAALPPAIYEGFWRAHAFGLSNQSFLQWLVDYGICWALILIGSLIVASIFYAAIRRTGPDWWIRGAAIAILSFAVFLVIYPPVIAPLFNHYSPLPSSALTKDILALAQANGVPANTITQVDTSRQSSRMAASHTGFLGTDRIALSDNLLHKASHDEVLAAAGQQMGHYIMGHTTRLLLLMAPVIIVGFIFIAFGFSWSTALFGGAWQVRAVDDVAGLPLLVGWGLLFLFLVTPVTNAITRTADAQADIFAVNATRKPDAIATLTLKRAAYQRLDAGPWTEALFDNHPSGQNRIHAMMIWKKAHIGDLDLRETASLPFRNAPKP